MKNVTSLLMLMMLSDVIQSSQAVRCYDCEDCVEPLEEYCADDDDACVIDIWMGGMSSFCRQR